MALPEQSDGGTVIEMRTIRQITGGKAAVIHFIDTEAKKAEELSRSVRGKVAQGVQAARAQAFRDALAIVQDTTDL
jgi:hypothetical protein